LRRRLWLRYLLLFGWMAIIFWLSGTPDLRAVPLAQRFGLLPELLGAETLHWLELVLRKSAHVLTFGLLAVLIHWALVGTFVHLVPPRIYLYAFLFTLLYAISDEVHQGFVPTRYGSPVDVAIDAAGAGGALLLVYRRAKRYTGHRGSM
jgi:VanZ family protein